MTKRAGNSKRIVAAVLAVTAVAALGALAYWRFLQTPSGRPASEVVSEEVAGRFYTSLAALDVEENERAARELGAAVQEAAGEPALWANLAVAQMRLRELENAARSLEQALTLAPESRELALLRAELLENSGEVEKAIEQLREVRRIWPENIAAAYSLSALLGQVRSQETDEERLALLTEILERAPENLRAQAEQARLAATLERAEVLRESLDQLSRDADEWPEVVQQQLAAAKQAAASGDFRQAAVSLTFFENVLKPRPEYQQSLSQLGVSTAAAIGTPLREFLKLEMPAPEAAEADVDLAFRPQESPKTAARTDFVWALEQAGEGSSTLLLSLSGDTLQAGESAALPFPGLSTGAGAASVAAADLNFDFRQDLIAAGPDGVRIYLANEETFAAHETMLEEFSHPWRGVWPFDVDADGDLDLLLAGDEKPLTWIRNNGDMTFTAMGELIGVRDVRVVRAVDLDGDGDVDLATLDGDAVAQVWSNERNGTFVAAPRSEQPNIMAIAAGDIDRDGMFELISLSSSGELHAISGDSGDWAASPLPSWPEAAALAKTTPGDVFLAAADLDNNGVLDLVASGFSGTAVRLGTSDGKFIPLAQPPSLRVTSIADYNNDGLLDLVGLAGEGARVTLNQSQAGYGWHVLRPLANTSEGDSRINSFGLGGQIEIRAGALTQAAAIDSPRVHFGLGNHAKADVARIVWPNGTMQAEFDLQAKQSLPAQQRLKGSCPWVFAFDGKEFRFVKDFIWRSPLGLRINAQATAGVTQTEDWIKIDGSYLAAVDGRYQIRITAELWESHFFDRITLLAVDHSQEVEVFVDERFIPTEAPALRVIATSPPQPLENLTDQDGQALTETLSEIDGKYADSFALGQYQGLAEEHWVAFELPPDASADRPVLLVGNGWIYPTDSSLNVAIAQGAAAKPFGLVLEQQDSGGAWRTVRDNLGFPAGKNKDVIIAIPGEALAASRKFRLRTNMEVYWDRLAWAYEASDAKLKIVELPRALAELRPRGYSQTSPVDRRRPDLPTYEVVATAQRWRDLEGYYTRFGDVEELLDAVEDRYVIMNAGDEIALEFVAPDLVGEGMRRDFVLVGDGWVKDGDLNTAFSRWIRPLPAHDEIDYTGPLTPLEDDPVYQRWPEDWQKYHTRYVTPREFQRGLWPRSAFPASGETQR